MTPLTIAERHAARYRWLLAEHTARAFAKRLSANSSAGEEALHRAFVIVYGFIALAIVGACFGVIVVLPLLK